MPTYPRASFTTGTQQPVAKKPTRCGWCGFVGDTTLATYNHVTECRKTQGEATFKQKAAEIQGWLNDIEPYHERVTLVISCDVPAPSGDVLDGLTKIEKILMQNLRNAATEAVFLEDNERETIVECIRLMRGK